MSNRPWTEDETARLREMWGRASKREIAAALGRSPQAVASKARKDGLPFDDPTGPPWTEDDLRRLSWEWGTCSLDELAKRLGRSPKAVRFKAWKMDLGPLRRGTYSMRQVVEMTGYDRGTILVAARRLGMKLRRGPRALNGSANPRGRHYAIEHEALERIIEEITSHRPEGTHLQTYTPAGEWGGIFRDGSPKPEACVDCGDADRPHRGRGRCRPCYDRHMGYSSAKGPPRRQRSDSGHRRERLAEDPGPEPAPPGDGKGGLLAQLHEGPVQGRDAAALDEGARDLTLEDVVETKAG